MATPRSANEKTIAELIELEQRAREGIGFSERLAHRISAFSGSMLFVWAHVIWFGIWIGIALVGVHTFDEPPFGILTMVVSLEAIFLSTFVLIAQNQQGREADKRAKIDLEINIIAEREITKVVTMLAEIQDHLDIGQPHDVERQEMEKETRIDELAEAAELAGTKAG